MARKKRFRFTPLGPCGHPVDRSLTDDEDYCRQCEDEANEAA